MADFSSLLFPGQTFTKTDLETMASKFNDKKTTELGVNLLFSIEILAQDFSNGYVRFNGMRLNIIEDWMNSAFLSVTLYHQPWPLAVVEDNGKQYCEVPLSLTRRNYNAWKRSI